MSDNGQAAAQEPLRLTEGDIFALIGRLYAENAVLRAQLEQLRIAAAQASIQQAIDSGRAEIMTQDHKP